MEVALRGSCPGATTAGIMLLTKARQLGLPLHVSVVGDPDKSPPIAGPAALAVGISASANEGIGIALMGAAIAVVAGSAALSIGPRATFGTVSLFTAALLAVLAVAEIVAGVKSV